MKNNLSLLVILVSFGLLTSCSKNIAPFQKSSQMTHAFERNEIPLLSKEEFKEILKVKETEIISLKEESKTLKEETKETSFETNNAESTVKTTLSKKENYKIAKKKNSESFNIKRIEEENNAKLNFVQKMAIKKLEAKANKAVSSGKVNAFSLLSFIFGILSLLTMITGTLGVLFAIAALITGIIALKRKTPNRKMAILGIIFGSIGTIFSLLVLADVITKGVLYFK
jgi:hypothetical protein